MLITRCDTDKLAVWLQYSRERIEVGEAKHIEDHISRVVCKRNAFVTRNQPRSLCAPCCALNRRLRNIEPDKTKLSVGERVDFLWVVPVTTARVYKGEFALMLRRNSVG